MTMKFYIIGSNVNKGFYCMSMRISKILDRLNLSMNSFLFLHFLDIKEVVKISNLAGLEDILNWK